VTLPSPVNAGFVVLLESPNAVQTDPTQWSDVLQFIDSGTGNTLRLFSDTGSFPGNVLTSPHTFITEIQTGTGNDFTDFTVYTADINTYNIYSGAPVNENETPEPASAALVGSGLIALIVRARRAEKTA
jgi:hypothetical protein